jgi:hypothetical protein
MARLTKLGLQLRECCVGLAFNAFTEKLCGEIASKIEIKAMQTYLYFYSRKHPRPTQRLWNLFLNSAPFQLTAETRERAPTNSSEFTNFIIRKPSKGHG